MPYEDSAEAELLEILAGADDRTSGSEELAAAIHDWPTLYHLSPERANLLAPIRIDASDRVVDLGAGTGVLARAVGETGARIVAIEGSLARARAVQLRCESLANVDVAVGSIADYRDPSGFDVALMVGVLEYSAAVIGGGAGPRTSLAQARSLLRPDGVLVLAIENQLGLRYLLGAPEDHLNRPYAGVEGYADAGGIRTFARGPLRSLLANAGFEHQWWAFPFPDYKLPSTIVAEAVYQEPAPWPLLDTFLREHVGTQPTRISAPVDPRACHRSFVEAGLGPEVANSFLVVASSDAAALQRIDTALLWRFDVQRRARWRRTTTLRRSEGGLLIERRSHAPRGEDRCWLRQRAIVPTPFVEDPSLASTIRASCEAGDANAIAAELQLWREHLERATVVPPDVLPVHPFAPRADERALPGWLLDANLANFLVRDGQELDFIDDEWETDGSVSFELVATRALWYLARMLLEHPALTLWPNSTTTDALTVLLGAECGLKISASLLSRFRHAEAELQHVVTGADPDAAEAELVRVGSLDATGLVIDTPLPLNDLYRALDESRDALARTSADARHAHDELRRIDDELHRILRRFPVRAYLRLRETARRWR